MTYGGGGGPPSLEVRGRLLTNMLLTPPPPPGAEKGHILGILGQKTGKNALKKKFSSITVFKFSLVEKCNKKILIRTIFHPPLEIKRRLG